MSQLVSRILLTILLFPSAALLLFVTFIFLERPMSDDDAIVVSTLVTCAYMAGYWLLLWWNSIAWTSSRALMTGLSAGAAVIVGAATGLTVSAMHPYSGELGAFIGSLMATVLWIIATICIWRENRSERAARLHRAGADTIFCPACGYNLTGLREARCPECGAHYTLNELLAGQRSRAAVEIEQS